MEKKVFIFLMLFCQVYVSISAQPILNESDCTIGVASGKATADGRPLLWKTRDQESSPNNEVTYVSSTKYKYVAVVNDGSSTPWMGVNDQGFAILNATSSDLPSAGSGYSNGDLMRHALGNLATVAEFEQLLISTNASGRQTATNIGVLDATGAAAIFETAGNEFWKFDANDSLFAPDGYVLRTNFAFNGDGIYGLHDGIYSIERYRRQVSLVSDFTDGDTLNVKSLLRTQMRDFSDDNSQPVSVPFQGYWQAGKPYGYIYCYLSICRSTSVSAAVIQSVLPGEPAMFSTLWAILGQPSSGIAVPYWPVGKTPTAAYQSSKTAPLCDVALQIKSLLFDYAFSTNYIDSYKLRDENGAGLWSTTFFAEDSILTATQQKLAAWRASPPATADMLAEESALAQYALSMLNRAYNRLTTTVRGEPIAALPTGYVLSQNYPNPFNPTTTIEFSAPTKSRITLKIFNLYGQEVSTLLSDEVAAGFYSAHWDATRFASGTYFYQLQAIPVGKDHGDSFVQMKKLSLIK